MGRLLKGIFKPTPNMRKITEPINIIIKISIEHVFKYMIEPSLLIYITGIIRNFSFTFFGLHCLRLAIHHFLKLHYYSDYMNWIGYNFECRDYDSDMNYSSVAFAEKTYLMIAAIYFAAG